MFRMIKWLFIVMLSLSKHLDYIWSQFIYRKRCNEKSIFRIVYLPDDFCPDLSLWS